MTNADPSDDNDDTETPCSATEKSYDITPLLFKRLAIGRFPRATFMSIHVWEYRIRRVTDRRLKAGVIPPDEALIQALIDGGTFAYSYVAPYPSPEVDGAPVHGPYKISELQPTDFAPTTLPEVGETIQEFLNYGRFHPHTIDELGLASELPLPVPDTYSSYKLNASPDHFHSMGNILGAYSDYVLIDRRGLELKEVVLGFD